MEVVQLPGMTLECCPQLTAIEQGGEHYVLVDLDLCLNGDHSFIPHILVETAEGSTGFGEFGVHFVDNNNCEGEWASKVCKFIHCIESLPIVRDVQHRASLEQVGSSPQSSWC